MKVLGGHPGKLAKDFDRAFRYALSIPGVACALIGVRNAEQVRQAVRAAKTFRPFSDAEMEETILLGEQMVRANSSESTILHGHRLADSGSVHHA
jgi:predicted aldo/keto reductase-like oxidoreductase